MLIDEATSRNKLLMTALSKQITIHNNEKKDIVFLVKHVFDGIFSKVDNKIVNAFNYVQRLNECYTT